MYLKDQILDIGVENVMFLVPMQPIQNILGIFFYTSSDDEYLLVPARIIEDPYKVEDGYKITLQSIYPEFGKLSFYQSDLKNMIKQDQAQMFSVVPII